MASGGRVAPHPLPPPTRPASPSASGEGSAGGIVHVPILAPGADPDGFETSPPGDRIVLQRGGGIAPDRICAVRTAHGILLARVLFKGSSLLLLPGEGESDFESVDGRTRETYEASSRVRTCC